ncbi:dehydrogenase [Sphingomonas sp. SRS2]|nr:dehydrogenase [Sphingomonas sp. SRS2]
MYDYVIVGAGSAGCVLANRLSEDGASVLLLEAGKWDRDPLIHIPIGIGKIFPQRMHDWGYFMEPDPGIDARGIECARGKVVGGSSSINVMAYVRGHRSDFDRWAANELDGWSYRDVLPYFRRGEAWEDGADAYRGGDGPLRVQRSRYSDPILEAFIGAGRQAGYSETPDYNGADQEGFGLIQSTIHRGRRCSAATAYLRPALSRRNLTVLVAATVARVLFDEDRASGIAYRHRGRDKVALARREVILCAGVIDTPKLLMLSGIGDPDELANHGIPVKVANHGVGKNFQDHLSVMVTYRRRDRGPFEGAMRYDRLAGAMVSSFLGMESFAGDVPIGVTAFLKTRPEVKAPDVQLIFLAAPMPARAWFRPFITPVADSFGCRVALLRPESRGAVKLASADPSAAPLIIPNFLTTQADRDTLREGLKIVREVVGQSDMTAHSAGEIAPGEALTTDEQLDAFIRKTSVTVHHPAGTCRMGGASDRDRVVDPQLRVCGVKGLRVVDASVMPDMVGGNINAVVMMIAEKAADMILGKPADFPPPSPSRQEDAHVSP